MFNTLLISIFLSCSSSIKQGKSLSSTKERFVLTDRSGSFVMMRDVKMTDHQLASRVVVYNENNLIDPLEKTISVSKVGKIKNNKALRPDVAQHVIWYDKEKYFSQLKTNLETKSLDVYMQSPEEQWNGSKNIEFPKAKIFCYFSQLPECVKFNDFVKPNLKNQYQFTIIWDSFPYHTETYAALSEKAFESATFEYEGEFDGNMRYKVTLSNQIIFYEFDINLEFDKMFWIAQGVTLVRKK